MAEENDAEENDAEESHQSGQSEEEKSDNEEPNSSNKQINTPQVRRSPRATLPAIKFVREMKINPGRESPLRRSSRLKAK